MSQNIDLVNAKFQIDYWMGSTTMTGYTSGSPPRFGDGNIRIWKKDGTEARNGNGLPQNGDLVMPYTDDMYYTAAQLGFTDTNRTITLYVEAHSASSQMGKEIKVLAKYLLEDSSVVDVEDTVRYTIKSDKFGLSVDSNNDSVMSRLDSEDQMEEGSPGKLIQVSKTEDFENRVPMLFDLPKDGFEMSDAVITFTIPDHLAVFTSKTGGMPIVSGQEYSKSQLGQLERDGCLLLYICASQESSSLGNDVIFVTADPDGDGPIESMTDQVVVTAFDFKYVRVYDANKIPNRSTRAVGVPETDHLYEDNPRSDYDAETTPGIVLGGVGEQMNYANIVTEVEFGPVGVGKYILWEVEDNNGCVVGSTSSGSFADSITVTHTVHPSSETRAHHYDPNTLTVKDIIISVGFDKNGDGILQDEEKSVPDFGSTLIGKAEYDYCYSQLTTWINYLGGYIYPDTSEFLRIFTGLNNVASYSSSQTITFPYGGTHQQSNGSGFDETQNITQGKITEYLWDSNSGFSSRILSSPSFFDKFIRPAIQNLKIDEFYQNNPGVMEHTFTVSVDKVLEFPNNEFNLHNSLKHCSTFFMFELYTKRGDDKPQMTGIQGAGYCLDFYDFRTYGVDDENGWASRLQACHVAGIRDVGEVFAIYVPLNLPEVYFPTIDYDNMNSLQDWWMLVNH